MVAAAAAAPPGTVAGLVPHFPAVPQAMLMVPQGPGYASEWPVAMKQGAQLEFGKGGRMQQGGQLVVH